MDTLLAAARGGRSESMVVSGDPGTGKSALLGYAREAASDFTVVEGRGVEAEADLAYAGLAQIVHPLLTHIGEIPEVQAQALRAAIALEGSLPVDRFAVCAATLSLLAEAATKSPLLCLVDDVHWLDDSTADALLFTARRLQAEGVVMILAARAGELHAFAVDEIEELRLEALDRRSAILLVRETLPDASAERVGQVVSAAQGNPLALIELPAVMTKGGITDTLAPTPVGEKVRRAFTSRVRTLSHAAQNALLVAAASRSGRLDIILPAIARLNSESGGLEEAETAGLVALDSSRVTFSHPLVRSAVYGDAAPRARREVHEALANSDVGDGSEERIWHRAAAALGPDDGLADALESLGVNALDRGAPAEAAAALERSAQLTIGDDKRCGRLLLAATAAWNAGMSERARRLIELGESTATDPLMRADMRQLLGRITTWTGQPIEAHAILLNQAEKIQGLDASREALLTAEAAMASLMAGEIRLSLETSGLAIDLAGKSGPAWVIAASVRGQSLLLAGRSDEARALLEQVAGIGWVNPLMFIVFQGLRCLEDFELVLGQLPRSVTAARSATNLGILPYSLAALAEAEMWMGSLSAALAHAAESVDLASQTGQEAGAAFSLGTLARVEAWTGRDDECRRHVHEALDLADRYEIRPVAGLAAAALGFLELCSGRPDHAVEALEPIEEMTRQQSVIEPAAFPWAPDLIEAYIRLGRVSDAERVLDRLGNEAKTTRGTWARAVEARARGLLADEDDLDRVFADALEWHDRTPTPLEKARTLLCYGQRLRRARRRSEARPQLESAFDSFDRCGAMRWADLAAAELRAIGERSRGGRHTQTRDLTPHEIQVALAVAEGATNREAAAALFLSVKTIEFHLRNIYLKLGVRSRTELARTFAAGVPEIKSRR
jgi:DNA-binding CsgD family transcriptional regulator